MVFREEIITLIFITFSKVIDNADAIDIGL